MESQHRPSAVETRFHQKMPGSVEPEDWQRPKAGKKARKCFNLLTKVFLWTNMCIYVCVYTYVHTYMHTCMHGTTAVTNTSRTGEAHCASIWSLSRCLCRPLSQQSNVCHCSASGVWRVASDERFMATGWGVGGVTEVGAQGPHGVTFSNEACRCAVSLPPFTPLKRTKVTAHCWQSLISKNSTGRGKKE